VLIAGRLPSAGVDRLRGECDRIVANFGLVADNVLAALRGIDSPTRVV
jgi:hypothetical protein